LRLAAAALCLFLCGVLIVLYARSYSYADSLQGPLPGTCIFEASLQRGGCEVFVSGPAFQRDPWNASSQRILGSAQNAPGVRSSTLLKFSYASVLGRHRIIVPLWLPLSLTVIAGAALGIRRPYRFRLCTLLIATTYIAVVLGLAVALSR
jgi:hypothetical protein